MPIFDWLFGAANELPRGSSMGWQLDLLALHAASDIIIAISFLALAAGVLWYLRRRLGSLHENRVVARLFVGLLVASGVSHLLAFLSLWYPIYGLEGVAKGATAVLSGAAVGLIWPLLPSLVQGPSSRQLAEVNERLRHEAEAHEATLRELEAARQELESRVEERTRELSLVKARFETALRGAKIYVFSQDRDLRYTWIYSPYGEDTSVRLIGRSDDEILSSPERESIVGAKRDVLASGNSRDIEVSHLMPEQRALFALHVDPTYGPDGRIDGIMGAAIDISRIRSLESEQRRLTAELGTALQRYETALHGSNVTVYTQDLDLRYTSISSPMLGREVDEIVGQLDDNILPPESRGPIVALKREVLSTGQPQDGEFRIHTGACARWYDVHIEPLRDISGGIVGLTCAAVDITGRKAGEAHLRDLMRELTHRSKNLLAVIQAMARQTARHTGTTEQFLEQFSARLQALAASHDLLVQESWYGASLSELVRSQLGHHLDRENSQVMVEGPSLLLKPEAAQSLGLALHELATNASKYGALSVPTGKISINWHRLPGDPENIEVIWAESGGPEVVPPQRRGFGTLVIERNLARSLDAEIDLSFSADGLRCRMLFPASNLATGP
jgi:PAS domain S-box-containing protein